MIIFSYRMSKFIVICHDFIWFCPGREELSSEWILMKSEKTCVVGFLGPVFDWLVGSVCWGEWYVPILSPTFDEVCKNRSWSHFHWWLFDDFCLTMRTSGNLKHHQRTIQVSNKKLTSWWFQIFFIFTFIWGRFSVWLIFFGWVETTN